MIVSLSKALTLCAVVLCILIILGNVTNCIANFDLIIYFI